MSKITKHHRKCKSNGGSSASYNISKVPLEKHICWHELFHNWTPERICREINEKYIDPEYEFICVKKEEI